MKLYEIFYVLENEQVHKLYHGSRRKFPVGFVLKPNRSRGDPEERAVEKILEYYRPKNKLSRQQSVYFVDTPDPDSIERAGGYSDYIYEVSADYVEKNDVSWWAEILNGGAYDFLDGNKEALLWCKEAAEAYWAGKPSVKPHWEYRAPEGKIIGIVQA